LIWDRLRWLWRWIGAEEKIFARVPPDPARAFEEQPRTVNDGTDNLVNLARLSDIRAGEASREGGQGIGAERLEGAGDGGRPGEGSPPEGPGETAVEKKNRVRGGDNSQMRRTRC
jgi:hypothetical protein